MALAGTLFLLPFFVFWRLFTDNYNDKVFINADSVDSIHPSFLHVLKIVSSGEFPVWNWHVYSGLYEGGAFYNILLYPLSWLAIFGPFDFAEASSYHLYIILHLSIGSLTFFWLSRTLRFNPFISFAGANMYSLSYYAVYSIYAGNAHLLPFAWMPAVLAAYYLSARKNSFRWVTMGAVFWVMCLISNMPLVIVPLCILLMFWIIYWGYEGKRKGWCSQSHYFFWCCFSFLIALCLWAGSVIPFYEAVSVVTRNSTAVYEWVSRGWLVEKDVRLFLKDLLIPYHRQAHLTIAFGTIGVPLFILGIILTQQKWAKVLGAFSLVIGSVIFLPNWLIFYDLVYLFVPLVDRLHGLERGSQAFLIPVLLVVMAGIRSLQLRGPRRHKLPYYFAAFLAFSAYFLMSEYYRRFGEVGESLNLSRLSLHGAILMGSGIVCFAYLSDKKHKKTALSILVILIALDTASLTRNAYFTSYLSPYEEAGPHAISGSQIDTFDAIYLRGGDVKTNEPTIGTGRIYQFRNQQVVLQGIDNVGGYYQLQPEWVAQAYLSAEFKDWYLFHRSPHSLDEATKWKHKNYKKLYDYGDNRIGRAFLVDQSQKNKSKIETLRAIAETSFDPQQTIYLTERKTALGDYPWIIRKIYWAADKVGLKPPTVDELKTPIALNEEVDLLAQGPSYAKFSVRGESKNLFFSTSWYPGWRAWVDGEEVPVYRANYAFLGIELPSDDITSIVEFKFIPIPYYIGITISFFTALLLIWASRSVLLKKLMQVVTLRRNLY